ncbi:MAG: DNRLRE domain-containing protein [Hyphomonadaceae bacterium]|nr:DNRLRE domain-containing protein [Hyphomonadaceae bacterium]
MNPSRFDANGYFVGGAGASAFIAFNDATNQAVLVFRGTEGFVSLDSISDLQIAIGGVPEQFDSFTALIQGLHYFISDSTGPGFGATALTAGHSLGGALAELFWASNPLFAGGVSTGSPGQLALGLDGIVNNSAFVHITRWEDAVGTYQLNQHNGITIGFADDNFSDDPFDIFADFAGGAHNHVLYASDVRFLLSSPIAAFLPSGDLEVRILSVFGANLSGAALGAYDAFLGSATIDILDGTTLGLPLRVEGLSGNDTIVGSGLADYLSGGSHSDSLRGGGGADYIWGGSGGDTLEGGADTDTIYGGADTDTLIGGTGSDTLYGESGNDTAVFERAFSTANYRIYQSGGFYVVEDRQSGDVDRLSSVEYLRFGTVTNTLDYWLNAANTSPPTQPPPTVPPVTPPATPPPSQGDDFGNSMAAAHGISNNTAFAGVIGVGGDQDWFSVTLQSGIQYSFSMAGGSYGGVSSLASPHLYLVNGAGDIIAHGAPVSTNSIFQFVPTTGGVYYLRAQSHGDQGTGAYGLAITPIGPAPPSPSPPPPNQPPGPVVLNLDEVIDIVAEDDGQLIFHVEYDGDLTEDIVIGWTLTGAGDDPIEAIDVFRMSGTVTLQSHDDDGYVTIRVDPQDDRVDEGDEEFEITIHVVSGNATIRDDDERATILNDDAGRIHPDVDEHSNSFTGATQIVHETWNRGFITTQGDVDFFAVTLTGGATYAISADGDSDTSLIDGAESGFIGLTDPHVLVYDSNFNLIGQAFAPVNRDAATYQFTPATTGLYYVAVREEGDNDIGQYFVRADIRVPADDFRGDATTSATLSEGELGVIRNERDGDDDWISVNLEANTTYSFFAVTQQVWSGSDYRWPAWIAELEIRVLNATGVVVASFGPGAVTTQTNQLTFTPTLSGEYFFSVRSPTTFSYSNYSYVVGFDAVNVAPAGQPIIIQPGPTDGADLYFHQVRDAGSTDPGIDTGLLRVGGQTGSIGSSGSALRFDLSSLPGEAQAAYVEIYLSSAVWNGNNVAPGTMVLAAAGAAWSETSSFDQLGPYLFQSWLAAPTGPGWYRIDITTLFNQWQTGALANNGLLLLPADLTIQINQFYSSDHTDAALRPRLVVYERGPGEIPGTNAAESLVGTALADSIVALGGDDLVSAGAGADIIEGGDGGDFINGSDGYDTASYATSPQGVHVDLAQNQASGGHAAGDSLLNVEHLIGSSHADTLSGDAGANLLRGDAGDDTLDGGQGADALIGGAGNDTFVVDNAGDAVTENPNEGSDQVRSSITFTLGANIENLTLVGGDATSGVGNTLANSIVGNSANNALYGSGGNDILSGEGGADILDGGDGVDRLFGGDGNDTIFYDPSDDLANVQGGAGSDVLVFTSGAAPGTFNLVAQGFEAAQGRFTDTGNANPWATRTIFYDTLWRTDLITSVNDDGTGETVDFDEASSVNWTTFLTRTDTLGRTTETVLAFDDGVTDTTDFDPGNTNFWSSFVTRRDALGRTTESLLIHDNGVRDTTNYDSDNSRFWTSFVTRRDDLGRQTESLLIHDSGVRDTTNYDAEDLQFWSSFVTRRDDLGRQTESLLIHDDGTRDTTNFDADNSLFWTSFVTRRDALGRQTESLLIHDDGTRDTTNFDPENNEFWSSFVTRRDSLGRTVDTLLIYDDGRRDSTDYDEAGAFNWANVVYRYDAAGILQQTITTYDNGSIVIIGP